MRHALQPYPYTRRTVRLGNSVDSLFNDLVRQFDEPALRGEWADDGLTLTVDLPGIAAEGIALSVADRVLTVAVDELGWKRSLRLRPNLDTDSVSARHLDGRLTIHVGARRRPRGPRDQHRHHAPGGRGGRGHQRVHRRQRRVVHQRQLTIAQPGALRVNRWRAAPPG